MIISQNFLPDFKVDGVIHEGFTITLMASDMFGDQPKAEWEYPFEDIEILASTGNLNSVTITITCKEGYSFIGTPYTKLSDYGGGWLTSDYTGNSTQVSYKYNLSTDYVDYKNKLPLNLKGLIDGSNIVNIEGIPFNKVYSPTYNELKELDNFRLKELNLEGNLVDKDLGKFITSLYSLPFEVEELGQEAPIFLGNVPTLVRSKTIDNQIINKSLGVIFVPDLTDGGTIGYSNITVRLYLPFVDHIEVKAIDIDNTILRIYFNLDVISGESTINIINSNTGKIIKSVKTQIGFKIPYELGSQIELNNSSSILFNDILVPYIEVIKLDPNNYTVIKNVARKNIATGIRYSQSDSPIINIKGTLKEQLLLKEQLKEGVYYNE